MTRVILNDEQVSTLRQAADGVQLCDSKGNLLGYLTRPFSEAELAEAERRSKSSGPWHTTAQVLEHLHSLDAK